MSVVGCAATATPVLVRSAENVTMKKADRPLLGVQRWDMYAGNVTTWEQETGYLPPNKKPHAQGYLKPKEWHDRAPFFCRRTVDVPWVEHPPNAGPLWFNYPFNADVLQKAMDGEIKFAEQGGVDFFIFNTPARTIHSNGWDLHENLDAYLKSKERTRVNFVVALFGHASMGYDWKKVELMMDETVEYMRLPTWQTVKGNRPLLPVLRPLFFKEQLARHDGEGDLLKRFVRHLRKRVRSAGLADPYIVGCEVSKTYTCQDEFEAAGFDSYGDYAGSYGGAVAARGEGPTYREATMGVLKRLGETSGSLSVIPSFSIEHYPWPRAKRDRWYYYEHPLPGDVAHRITVAFDYVKAHPKNCDADVVFMYSWNEHSEGGGLCPTMGEAPDYEPNTTLVDELGAAIRAWKPKE